MVSQGRTSTEPHAEEPRTLASTASLAGYDQAAILNAVSFLQTHGAQLLVILKHSPEFRDYVQHAINHIDRDGEGTGA